MKLFVVDDFESKSPDVKASNRDQKDCWNPIDESKGANYHNQIFKAKDEINDQFLPLFHDGNHSQLFSCRDSVRRLSSSLSLFVLACVQKDVVVDVDVADAVEETLVEGFDDAHWMR